MYHTRLPLIEKCQKDAEKPEAEAFDWLGRTTLGRELGGRRSFYFFFGSGSLLCVTCFGFYFNLVTFLRTILHQGNAIAASTAANWFGSTLLCSFFGAFFAESFMGRLWTSVVFLVLGWTGWALLTFSESTLTTRGISSGRLKLFYFSLSFTAFCSGSGMAPMQSLGADQLLTDEDKSLFFSGYLVSVNIGIAIANTVVMYVASARGWMFAFGLCLAAGTLGLVVFLVGLPVYRQYKNSENPFCRALQVLVAAARKWNVEAPPDHHMLYEMSDRELSLRGRRQIIHTESLRYLEKAGTIVEGDIPGQWSLCTVTQVEELKSLCRLAPIGVTTLFFFTMNQQSGTLFVEQGYAMNPRIGNFRMQPATMNMFCIATIVLFPAIYLWLVVPAVHVITKTRRGLSTLHRIGLGYVVTMLAITIAAVMEAARLRVARKEGLVGGISNSSKCVSMSIFWLIPQYVLMGAGQFLVMAGINEFFYTEAPDSMRSVGISFCLLCEAMGSNVSSILVTIVSKVTTDGGASPGWIPTDNLNEGHLDYFYLLEVGIALISFLCFVKCASLFLQATRTTRTG